MGSHLCERSVSSGHSVAAINNFSTGNPANLIGLDKSKEITLTEGSILNTNPLTPLVHHADYALHLAAAVCVFNIVNNPLDGLVTNIRGTENVLSNLVL